MDTPTRSDKNIRLKFGIASAFSFFIVVLIVILVGISAAKADKNNKTALELSIYQHIVDTHILKIGFNDSNAYEQCSKLIEEKLDPTIDPCDDFFGYACNLYQGPSVLNIIGAVNQVKYAKFLKDSRNFKLKPAQQAKIYFDKCVAARNDWNKTTCRAGLPETIIKQLEVEIGIPFPLANRNPNTTMDPKMLAKAIGYLNGNYDAMSPLIKMVININPVNTSAGYILYAAPMTLNVEHNTTKKGFMAAVTHNLITYFDAVGIKVDNETINDQAKQMAVIQEVLGATFNTAQPQYTTVREFATSIDSVIDVSTLLSAFALNAPDVKDIITNPNYLIMAAGPQSKFVDFFKNLKTRSVGSSTIWNYIFYSIIHSKSDYLSTNDGVRFEGTKKIIENVGMSFKVEIDLLNKVFSDFNLSQSEVYCTQLIGTHFTEISNRLFMEAIYPDRELRKTIKDDLKKMITGIIIAFKSMFEQTDWLATESRERLIKKLNQISKNILYKERVFNETFLHDYYGDLKLNESMNYLDMELLVGQFIRKRQILQLKSRLNIELGDISSVNAAYKHSFNSINLAAGFVQEPVYDIHWPKAYNYGAYGSVVSHELAHGFDNGGIHYGIDGSPAYLLDPKSEKGFNNMIQCIVDEYNQFCIDSEHCVNGTSTKSENIADNTGVQTIYHSYKRYAELNGEDPALPGPITGKLTNDQLFFVAFGQISCQQRNTIQKDYRWKEDVHSPVLYRVLGTLQNFRPFRVAFNCPLNSTYAPEKTCKAWITDIVVKSDNITKL